MMANAPSHFLAFRPRRKPPAPSAVNSWALKNINIQSEQPARQHTVLNLGHLRNALIGARHFSGEPEDEPEVCSGLLPTNPGSLGAYAAPTPVPITSSPQAASGRQALAGGPPVRHPPYTAGPGGAPHMSSTVEAASSPDVPHGQWDSCQRRSPPHHPPSQVSFGAGTSIIPQTRPSTTLSTPGPTDRTRTAPQLPPPKQPHHQPRPQPQPQASACQVGTSHPPGGASSSAPASRSRALGLSAPAQADWDAGADLLDGLDGPEWGAPLGVTSELRQPATWTSGHGADVGGGAAQQRGSRGGGGGGGGAAAGGGRGGLPASRARSPSAAATPSGDQLVGGNGAEEDPRGPGLGFGDAVAAGGGGGGRGEAGGRWWEDLDELLGRGGEAGGSEVGAASAGRSQQRGSASERSRGGPRQALLTPSGGCMLPPPPLLGASWKPARPAASEQLQHHAPAPAAAAAAAATASGGARGKQQQQQIQTQIQTQAQAEQVPGLGKGTAAAATGTSADRKRARVEAETGGGLAAAPFAGLGAGEAAAVAAAGLAAGGGAGAGGGAKKKGNAGGKDAVGGPAQAMLSQLLPLCEALEAATGNIRNASDPRVASELRHDVSRSRLLLTGLLLAVCEGPVHQYATNMQFLSKPQRDSLLKARRVMAKDPAAAAALNAAQAPEAAAGPGQRPGHTGPGPGQTDPGLGPRFGSGVLASEHLERCVAFCVLCLDEQLYGELLGGSGSGGAVGGGGGRGGGSGGADLSSALADAPMYVLRTMAWPPGGAGRGSRAASAGASGGGGGGASGGGSSWSAPLPRAALLSLLDEVLGRAPCPTLCCNSKALLREALSLGWRSPPPQRLQLVDPCVMAWMEAPQLAQRDEKEIEGA